MCDETHGKTCDTLNNYILRTFPNLIFDAWDVARVGRHLLTCQGVCYYKVNSIYKYTHDIYISEWRNPFSQIPPAPRLKPKDLTGASRSEAWKGFPLTHELSSSHSPQHQVIGEARLAMHHHLISLQYCLLNCHP